MTDRKVVPFRSGAQKRPPSEAELKAYRDITRGWSPALRQLLLPEFFSREPGAGDADSPHP